MTKCAVCRREMLGGFREGVDRFCSPTCYTAGPVEGFCEACLSGTTDEPAGNTHMVNGIGTRLIARGARCAKCHSVQARKWFVFVFIPIFPLACHRVRWKDPMHYVGRKLRVQQ